MTKQEYVLSQYPTAKCLKDEPCHQKDIPCFMIAAKEDDVVFVLGHSYVSENDAWNNAKNNIGEL